MAEENSTSSETAPAELLSGMHEQGLSKPLIVSIVFHIILIGVFSVGYIGLCMKYNTLSPKEAQKAEQEQLAQAELEKKRKMQSDSGSKEDSTVKNEKASDSSSVETKKVPKVIKDTEEVIKEKPKKPSSLDTFDDDL